MNDNTANKPHNENPEFIGTGSSLTWKSDSPAWRELYAPTEFALAWDCPVAPEGAVILAAEARHRPGVFTYVAICPLRNRGTSKVHGSRAYYAPRGYRVHAQFLGADGAVEGDAFEAWIVDNDG